MDVTKRLLELDPTLTRHNEGFWQEPFDPEKKGSYSSFNDAGIEVETGEFLYGLCRLMKPEHVLETGTHVGVSTVYMASALQENRKGDIDTVEFLEPLYRQALDRFKKMGFFKSTPKDAGIDEIQKINAECVVHPFLMDAAQFFPLYEKQYDIILLDTEPQTRFAELVKFFPLLKPGGMVFIHDLHQHMHQNQPANPDHPNEPNWPYGMLPEEIKELVKTDQLRPMHFATPRGLTGFYKVHPNDYKF